MENGQVQTATAAASTTPELVEWPVPGAIQDILKKNAAEQQNLLASLGALEVEYLTARNKFLQDLANAKQRWQTTLNEAARAGGLDIDKEKWVLDGKSPSLRLVREA